MKQNSDSIKQQICTDAIMHLASTLHFRPVMTQATNFPGALIIRFNVGSIEVSTIIFKDGTLNTTTK